MKINPSIFLPVLAFLSVPAFGIERPSDEPSLPTLPEPQQQAMPQFSPANATQQKIPVWLGVVTTPVPSALCSQLKLQGFPGVMVESVSSQSPARKAGIQQYDIILKVGERSISDSNTILDEVAKFQPGQSVPLEIFRGGSKQTVSVKIEQRPAGMASAPDQFEATQNKSEESAYSQAKSRQARELSRGNSVDPFEPFEDSAEQAIRDLLRERTQWLQNQRNSQQGSHTQQALKALSLLSQFANQANNSLQASPGRQNSGLSFSGQATSSLMRGDAQGWVIISDDGSGQKVTVKDPFGKVLFSGPYSAEAEKAAVPENIRKRIEQFSR